MDERLPEGWVWAKIDDISDVIGGSTPSRSEQRYFGGDIIWLTPTEIPKETVSIIFDSKEKLTEEGFEESGVRWIPANSVLLTSRASIGYVAIAGTQLTTNQGFASFALPEEINSAYFGWWLKSQKSMLETLAGGTTFKEISKTTLKEFFLPLAPFPEQIRIVAAIEQQFTRLDSAVASLHSAKARIKQYRASLLKAAVEGELIKEWRAMHPTEETGVQLLARILIERRTRWEEEQLAKMHERGITPKDDGWKQAYKEPQGPDVAQLPELPDGWCWAMIEQLADVGTGATPLRSRNEYYDGGTIPWITSGAVNTDFIISAEEFITEKALAETNAKLFPIGTLVLAMYGEGKTRGKVSELKIEATTNQACAAIVFRPSSFLCQPYAKYFLMSNYFKIRSLSVGGVQPNLNLTIVKETALPFPPLSEQEQIVAEVEAGLSNIARMEETIEASLKRAEHERRSILREAFAGLLVPQDSEDEPASVLLERIREERKKHEEAEKVTRASRKGVQMTMARKQRAGKASLYTMLVEAARPLSPDDLFKRAGLKVDEQHESAEAFYEELHADVEDALIEETRSDDGHVLLNALEPSSEMLARMMEEKVVTRASEAQQSEKAIDAPRLWNME